MPKKRHNRTGLTKADRELAAAALRILDAHMNFGLALIRGETPRHPPLRPTTAARRAIGELPNNCPKKSGFAALNRGLNRVRNDIREINDRALGRPVQPNESANAFVSSADPVEEVERLEREIEQLR